MRCNNFWAKYFLFSLVHCAYEFGWQGDCWMSTLCVCVRAFTFFGFWFNFEFSSSSSVCCFQDQLSIVSPIAWLSRRKKQKMKQFFRLLSCFAITERSVISFNVTYYGRVFFICICLFDNFNQIAIVREHWLIENNGEEEKMLNKTRKWKEEVTQTRTINE